MKKIILSLLACGSIAAANAQAGSILVYGNVGITSTSNDDDTKALSWNVTPGIGYQLDKCWTIGAYADYANSGTKGNAPGDVWVRQNDMELGLFVRHTCQLNRIFSVFGQLNAGWTHGNQTLDGSVINDTRYNGFSIMLMPAISANIHNGWALNFSIGGIGYNTRTVEHADNSTNQFKVNFGQTMVWGIQKNIGGFNHRIHREPGSDRHMKNYRDDDGDSPRKHKKSNDDNDE